MPQGTWSIQPSGPLGDPYASISSGGIIAWNSPELTDRFYFGCRVNTQSSGFTFRANTLDPANPTAFYVYFTTSGDLVVYQGFTGTVIASATTTAPINGWWYFEIYAYINATAGAITICVNGAVALTVSGVDTHSWNSGYTQMAQISLAPHINNNNLLLQHCYLNDSTGSAPNNGFLGDVRVQALFPVANASVAFVANGTDSNWVNAAMVPPNPNIDYNASNTVNAIDTFTCQPMASNLGAIYAVNVKTISNKTSSGEREMAALVVSDGVTAVGANVAIATDYKQYQQVFETDPSTATAWTQSGVDALQIGYKITS